MPFIDYWSHLKQKNPSLCHDDSKMTISVASFKKQLEKAYKAGSNAALTQDKKGPFESFMDSLFGS